MRGGGALVAASPVEAQSRITPVIAHTGGVTKVTEGGAEDSFTYTLTQQWSGCRTIEVFAGAGLEVSVASSGPFGLRARTQRCAVFHRHIPTEFYVRAVEDSWDVPGIWRRPGLTGDTWSSEVRIYEIFVKEFGPPVFAPVRVPVTIVDNDPPMVSLHGGAAVTEGSAASFTVKATSPPTSALTVRYVVRQNDPFVSYRGDFVAPGDLGVKSVRLPAGQMSATFSVPTVADDTDEPDGLVRVTLETGVGYTLAAPRYQEVAVADDDPADEGDSDDGSVPDDGSDDELEPKSDSEGEPGSEGEPPSLGDGDGGSDGDEPSQAACGSAEALAVKARANHDALPNTAGNRKERNDWWRAWIALSAKTGTYNTPLTAAEARALESGDARWTPYRQALECLEGAP